MFEIFKDFVHGIRSINGFMPKLISKPYVPNSNFVPGTVITPQPENSGSEDEGEAGSGGFSDFGSGLSDNITPMGRALPPLTAENPFQFSGENASPLMLSPLKLGNGISGINPGSPGNVSGGNVNADFIGNSGGNPSLNEGSIPGGAGNISENNKFNSSGGDNYGVSSIPGLYDTGSPGLNQEMNTGMESENSTLQYNSINNANPGISQGDEKSTALIFT